MVTGVIGQTDRLPAVRIIVGKKSCLSLLKSFMIFSRCMQASLFFIVAFSFHCDCLFLIIQLLIIESERAEHFTFELLFTRWFILVTNV